MATQITYKQRNQYLLIGFFLLAIIVYQFAIAKTWNILVENQLLSAKLEGVDNAPADINLLSQKERMLNDRLENYLAKDTLGNQGYLLQEISTLCAKNRLILKEFPQAVGQSENDYQIRTIETAAQGNFIGLLRLAFQLEKSPNVGRLSALKFDKLMDYQTRKEILVARYYFQTIQEK